MSINPNDNKKPYSRKDAIDAAMANAPARNKGAAGLVGDTLLSGLSSAIAVPELAVGLADIPTGGRVGKFLENEGGSLGFRPGQAKEAINSWKSEQSQEQMREFQDTEGFGAKLNYARKNPSMISNTVVESLAPMLAGGVVGRGLGAVAKGLSPVAAGALGEGVVGAGLAAEQIRQQTDDGLLTGKQAGLAAATGATTAGFGFAGGKIAQKLGIGDVDTLLASGSRTVNGNKGVARRIGEGALTEGLLEELPQSVSETILQNEALGRPLDEGVTDAAALGLLSGAAMGGAVGGFARNRVPVRDDVTPTEDMGQEVPRLGLPNPNRPGGGNQLGYQGALSDPNNPNWIENANPDYFNRGQGPDASNMRNLNPDPELPFNSELGGQFSATQDGTVFTEAEYNEYLAQQQAQARADRDAGMTDINDVTQVPEGYERYGSDPRLPAPRSDFEVTPDGTVQTAADVNTNIQNERAANAERLASRLRGDIQDNTPVPNEASGFGDLEPVDNRKLSERMGLDPSKGGLSAAAAIAVDTGASSVAADFDQASAPSQTAWQQSMNDRLQMADQSSPEYQALSQAMANEPASVPAKNKMLRDAAKLPSKPVDSKVVDPKARVIDESRAQTKAYTPKGDEVQAQWDVVDASQLVTSNTDTFTPNPDFPSERQPRDRTRAGSQKQVNDIANKLQPNMLGESSDISTGSPFIGANDNVVDSGNGRTMAIRRAYQEGSEKSKEYRQFVSESAGKYGLDVNAVNNMQAPVLVRRNMSNMDRNQFASEANQTAVARMSSTEQAATDAKKLPDASLLSFGSDGAMNLYQSSGYIKNFISGLPNTEQASMMDDNGALSQEGKRRVEAAIIQDAYDAPNLVTAISETLGEGSKNILKVVTDKAPQISKINNYAKTGDGYASTLSKDIADAAQAYMDITKSGEDVESYLSKGALFDDGLSDDARDILKSFYDNRRSAKAMGENIQERINAVTGKGNPKQGGLSFDEEQTSEAAPASSENGSPEVQDLPATTPEVTTNDSSKTNDAETNNNEMEVTAAPQPKTYVQVQTEVADEMGITTNEDGEYDISDAQFDVMEGRVRERMEAQDNNPEADLAEKYGFKDSNRLDQGELSIPNRTKNLDKDLENYKRDKAKLDAKKLDEVKSKNNEKAEAEKKRLVPIKDRAWSEYKQHGTAMIKAYRDKFDAQGINARDFLRDEAKYSPDSFLKLAEKFKKDQSLDGVKFSRTENTTKDNTKGLTNTTRQQVINKLSDKFGKETISNLIADGKLDIKMLSDFVKNGRLTIPSDVDGLYLNGKATLIADNLSDEMIIPTFLHELGGHGGMQTLMDKKAYNSLMKDFEALVKAGDPLAVHAKTIADKVARNKQEALDEYLPYLLTLASRQQVRQGKIAGMINRMVMAVRSFLRDMLGVSIKINSQDILSLAERMVNEVEKQNSAFDAMNAMPQFSEPSTPDKQTNEVRKKYKGTDEWLKTPNGNDTNLTEQQWLQVRTPAFKERFGDWEMAANNKTIVSNIKDARQKANSFKGKPLANIETGMIATISRNSLDKMLSASAMKKSKSNEIHLTAVANLDSLFNDAIHGWDKQDRDGDENITAVSRLFAPLVVEGKAYLVKMTVKQLAIGSLGNRIYTVEGLDVTNRNPVPDMVDADLGSTKLISDRPHGASINSLVQRIEDFNKKDSFSILDKNNGEPTPSAIDDFNSDMKFSRAAGMNDEFDPRNIAKETATRLYDWASSAPPGKLSWWHKTIGTMYNLAQRNPAFKPVFDNTEKFINDVSFYASKASEFAPRLLPQLDSIRDITKSAIGAKDNEALSKPIFEGTLLWGRDLDGKAVLIEDWRKKVMATSKQDRLQMLRDANRITPAQIQELSTLNNIQANRFINGIIDEEVNAGLVWTDNELRSKFDLDDKQIELYREFRATTDNSLDSMTRSDMLRRLGKDAAAIETAVMEAGTLREAVFNIEQHINSLIQASPKKEKSLKNTLKDIKESQFRTNKLIDDGYAPLSRFGQYTVDVVDADGNREYFGMFESAYEARKMKAEMDALYGNDQDFTVTQGALSNEEFKLFAGVTPETAELFGEMLGLDATGDKAADDAFQEYLRRTKNNRSTMKRLMHRKGIKGYSEDVGRVLASFVYSNARHTSAALNMGNLDRSIQDIPKGEGQLKDAAVKLAQYIKNPQEEGQLIRGWMFAQYLGGSIASAAVNLTQPIAVSFPYLSQFGGAVKAASQLSRSSSDWAKSLKNKNNDHFEVDLREAIERAEADGTLSPQEVHNLLKQASGKNPLSAGDGTKVGDAKALASNTLSRVSLAWGSLFSLAEQVNRRVTFVAAYRMAVEQGMDNPAGFATNSIKETQFVYNKASRMNWGRGAVGGTLMTFKTYTVSYMELVHRLWTQGEPGSQERAQGRKATMIMMGTLFLLGGAGGLPFMEDAEDLIDGMGQIMGYNFSSKKVRQDFLDAWVGETMGDFIDGGISSIPGSPTDVSGRLGLGNLIPGTGVFKERTNNTRDILEIAGPAGDFVGRIGTGSRDIAKGVVGLDTTSLKKGALEFAPTAVRNAVKGIGMATSGIYKDTKGYKVADVSPVDAAFKAIGFQPRDISKIQEANYLGQSATSYYNLRASSIRALWASGVVEKNDAKVSDAKAAVQDWNTKNPDQKIIIKPTDIARRVREMRMDKADRVTKLAPKSMRGQMAQDFAQVRDGG